MQVSSGFLAVASVPPPGDDDPVMSSFPSSRAPIPLLLLSVFSVFSVVDPPPASAAAPALRAGAFAQDISPTQFPVIVNGGFTEVLATKANDTLHARAIVLDDGKEKIAIVVVDS